MIGTGASPLTTLATPRRALRALVLLHLPMVAFVALVCATGLGAFPHDRYAALDTAVALAVGAVQLTLSVKVALGRDGPERYALYGVILLLVTLPMLWTDLRWMVAVWFVSAAGAMALPSRLRVAAFVAPIILAATWVVHVESRHVRTAELAYLAVYYLVIFTLGAACLLAATRVVPVVRELWVSRAELADFASRAERQRAGRDLHDTLGQRLSAVSVKGNLALALLERQPELAQQEIDEISIITREAVDDLDDVAHADVRVTLAGELRRAVALLHSAGVSTEVNEQATELPPDVDSVFAWAVREGTTNLLRHSTSTLCLIQIQRVDERCILQIVNDGAGRPSGRLGGLAGLAERARARGGTAEAGRIGHESFRLRVAIPLELR